MSFFSNLVTSTFWSFIIECQMLFFICCWMWGELYVRIGSSLMSSIHCMHIRIFLPSAQLCSYECTFLFQVRSYVGKTTNKYIVVFSALQCENITSKKIKFDSWIWFYKWNLLSILWLMECKHSNRSVDFNANMWSKLTYSIWFLTLSSSQRQHFRNQQTVQLLSKKLVLQSNMTLWIPHYFIFRAVV